MGQTIAQKIIAAHLVDGKMEPGCEVGLRIDQTLTQDATGTMAYLEYEAMGIPRVRTELSVAYIDHNTLQSGFMNADDHRFIRTIAKKIGVRYSRPGNGICHQVHLERFAKPGKTLIGSDSHRLRRAASAALPWVRAVWTWPWPWAAARIISPIQKRRW
jgi:aconitate hydratase